MAKTSSQQRGEDWNEMRNLVSSMFAILSTLCGNHAFALSVSLDFNSLPSTQGWTLINATGRSESQLYTANGSVLQFDTMGVGSGYAYYQIPGIVDPTQGYSIIVRARVLAEERGTQAALQFAAEANNWYSYVGIGQSSLNANDITGLKSISFDSTAFHTYNYTVLPNGHYDLSVDGASMLSGSIARAALPNVLYFGDATTGDNGKAEISLYQFNQPVPEPNVGILLAAGLLAVAAYSKARRG